MTTLKHSITAAIALFLSLASAEAQDIFPARTNAADQDLFPALTNAEAQDLFSTRASAEGQDLFPVRNVVRMGVLLPFAQDNAASLKGNMDFYFGALLAVRDLGKEGIDVEVDTKDYSICSFQYMQMRSDDFVIGPVKYGQLCTAKETLCPYTMLVSPLDHKADALIDSSFVQGAALNEAQWAEMISWEIEENGHFGTNFIVVKSEADTSSFRELSTCLHRQGINFKICDCDVSHNIKGWEHAYHEGMSTCVILALSNEATLNNGIRNMGILSRDKQNIRIYAGSKVTSYKTIPVEDVHKIGLRVVCPYYVDYKDKATLDFIHSYRALYNSEPSQFAFQGYDLTYYMAKTRYKFGCNWKVLIDEEPQMKLLQSNVMIRRTENGGFANIGTRRVQYTPDFQVILQ